MKSLSSIGLGLSVVFGCLLLALVAEVYYLLWWKKRITNREIETDYSSPVKELFYMFCWKEPSSLRQSALNPGEICNSMRISDTLAHDPEGQFQAQANKDFVFKPFGQDAMEEEYMRQHDLSGPPRFLFTIVEETKEDLESEDAKSRGELSGKGSRGRSLNDFLFAVETPYLTPTASPSLFTPPLTPMSPYNQRGFNPFFESATDAEFNRMKSSPPPKFKFLQDAEEKLRRKLREENESKVDETDDSFITVIVDKRNDRELSNHPNTSQLQISTFDAVSKYELFIFVQWLIFNHHMPCKDDMHEETIQLSSSYSSNNSYPIVFYVMQRWHDKDDPIEPFIFIQRLIFNCVLYHAEMAWMKMSQLNC